MNPIRNCAVTALLLSAMTVSTQAQAQSLGLPAEASSWQTVLDGVMGGRSSGRVTTTKSGTLLFAGKLSLENNGGFSQVRRAIDGTRLAEATGLLLECRGDGRTYNFDVRVANARMMAGGFQQSFDTVPGEWIRVELPFDGFVLRSFGRDVRNAPRLQPELIESIGVTLSDKVAGPFELEIRSIEAKRTASKMAATGGDAGPGNDLATVARAAGLTTLLDLVKAAELELPDSPVTIFAPTNEAFAKLPAATVKKLLLPESRNTLRQILTFHVANGARTSADIWNARTVPSLCGQLLNVDANKADIAGASIVAVDVGFDGGIVHVIDTVLMPEQRSISQIAAEETSLSTLMTAVGSANLARHLEQRDGPWTVLAPVNSAFGQLPEGTVASLLEPKNLEALTQILGLHVVPGRIPARELLAKKQLTTLLGQSINVSLRDGNVILGTEAKLIKTDIQAQNGVIHLIDKVLLPTRAASETDQATRTGEQPTIATEASRIYALAVDRGVPLFNNGQIAACAAVYEVAVESMIGLGGERLGSKVLARLRTSRADAKASSSSRDQAWILRRALDDAYMALQPTLRPRNQLPAR